MRRQIADLTSVSGASKTSNSELTYGTWHPCSPVVVFSREESDGKADEESGVRSRMQRVTSEETRPLKLVEKEEESK